MMPYSVLALALSMSLFMQVAYTEEIKPSEIEALAHKSIQKIPTEQFLTLYNIHVETSKFTNSHKTLAEATVEALKEFGGEFRRHSWTRYKKSTFDLFYDKRIVRPCKMIKSVCETFCEEIDRIATRESEVFKVSHLGSIRQIDRICHTLEDEAFRNLIYPAFTKSLRNNGGKNYIQASLLLA